MPAEWVTVGQVGAPYAVRGWIKIRSFTDPEENILGYTPWMLDGERGWTEIGVEDSQVRGGELLVRFAGCECREQAQIHAGRTIAVPKDRLPEPDNGEFYWHQLIGLQVTNRSGERLGPVTQMMATGTHDVMVVRGDADSVDQRERLIPWVEGRYVMKVDLAGGRIEVDWEADY